MVRLATLKSGTIFPHQRSGRRARDEHVNVETDQLISQSGEPVELVLCGSILESHVLALNIAEFTKLSPE